MRIVLACRATGAHKPGGLGHVIDGRAEALGREGHDVHVLTTPLPGGKRFPQMEGVTFHALGQKPRDYDDSYAESCAALCNRLSPDVIHLDSFDRHRRWWEEGPGAPDCIAVSLHGEDVTCSFTEWRRYLHGKQPDFHWDTKRIRAQIDAMKCFDVCISTAIFDQWAFTDLLGLGKSPLVYNPVPDYFFENVSEPRPNGQVGFFCQWGDAERGFEYAKQAADRVGVPLHTPKNKPRVELPIHYDRCRCLVLPSFQSQGFDVSVAEAIVRRRPVITSDVGLWWFEERFDPRCGIKTVPLGDVDALAEAIRNPVPVAPGAGIRYSLQEHAHSWLQAVCG